MTPNEINRIHALLCDLEDLFYTVDAIKSHEELVNIEAYQKVLGAIETLEREYWVLNASIKD